MIEKSLINEIVAWNIKELPDNTLEMQLKKIDEENEEYKKAVCDKDVENTIKEAADICISIIGLKRFNVRKFIDYEDVIIALTILIGGERLNKAIKEKFNILKKRKYVVVNGVYRHVELN